MRCTITRLGCEFSRPANPGAMVHGGTKVSQKCLGAEGNQISYNSMSFTLKERDAISVHIRMDSMTTLSYLVKTGGYQKPRVDSDQQRNLTIPFETKDNDYCWILTRVNEYIGRQGIQANQVFRRMEPKLNNLHETVSHKGNSRDGSVCPEGITPITLVYILENWLFQLGQRYFSDILGS